MIKQSEDLKSGAQENKVHIGVTFDQNYYTHFFVLAASIVTNVKLSQPVIHALTTGLSDSQKDQLKQFMEKNGGAIHFYPIDKSKVESFVMTSSLTYATYYRLFFGELLPEDIERLLYIDIDTLVLKDLTALFHTDLGTYVFAAVYDNYIKTQPLLGLSEEGQYFNAGVMLMDLKKWRMQRVSEQVFKYLETYPDRIKYPDQCAMNGVFKGNWYKLSFHNNCMYSYIPEGMDASQRSKFIEQITIIHFTIQRPWTFLCRNRYRYLYFHYLGITPISLKNKYTDFSWSKIPAFIKLRLLEFYFDSNFVRKVWRLLAKR